MLYIQCYCFLNVIITDNLERSSKTVNDHMFGTKIKVLTQKTVLKVSLFQTYYYLRLM